MRVERWAVIAVLGAAAWAMAAPGQWKQLGKDRDFAIDASNGSWKEIGKGDFGKARLLAAVGDSAYSIESDGTLFQIATK